MGEFLFLFSTLHKVVSVSGDEIKLKMANYREKLYCRTPNAEKK